MLFKIFWVNCFVFLKEEIKDGRESSQSLIQVSCFLNTSNFTMVVALISFVQKFHVSDE